MARQSRHAQLVFILLVAIAWFRIGVQTAAAAPGIVPDRLCTNVCGSYALCDEPCYPSMEEQETTCGDYDGGSANGWCEAGESNSGAPAPTSRFILPDDGLNWLYYQANYPDPEEVGNCFGNCGPGCVEWSICGSPEQKWELTHPYGLTHSSGSTCICADDNNLLDCGTADYYYGTGRWTYHGWTADGCHYDDYSCYGGVFGPWNVFMLIVDVATGWGNWWFNLLVSGPYTCWDAATFAEGGGCSNAGAVDWWEEKGIFAGTFTHSYYDYGSPGVCYSGPPKCGDGICQSDACLVYSGGGQTFGDGCEEDSNSCYADCG